MIDLNLMWKHYKKCLDVGKPSAFQPLIIINDYDEHLDVQTQLVLCNMVAGIQDAERILQPLDLVVVAAEVIVIPLADIEVDELIDHPLVEPDDLMDRVAEYLMNLEQLATHQKTALQQQNRDQALLQHAATLSHQLRRTRRPAF